jgi:mRNA interferase MazF
LAALTGDDVILCQITSRVHGDSDAIPIVKGDFATGGLRQDSNVRPNRLFTADSHIILYQAGSLNDSKIQEIITKVVQIFTA